MAKEIIEVLVEGGKTSAAPPLGPALGPLGVNIGEIVSAINKKTVDFKGMKVPVKVIVDKVTKEYNIEVGTPPVSQLIKKELGLQKGSGEPNINKVANMAIEQVIKVAKMKAGVIHGPLKSAMKVVIGSCNSSGILVEGKSAVEINKDIDAGKYDDLISKEITEASSGKFEKLKEDLDLVQKSLEKERVKLEDKKKEAKPKEGEKKEAETTEKKEEAKIEEKKAEPKKSEGKKK